MRNMMLVADMYKYCHKNMYPDGMSKLYCTWTPRSNKFFPQSKFVIWFGLQGFIKEYLVKQFNEYFFDRPLDEVIDEYKLYIHNTFDENAHTEHIEALHKLGYLPIEIKALPEGTKVPYRVPCCTVENTHPDFAWVTNYLETLFSCNLWLPTTTATRAYIYRKIIEKYIALTSDNPNWKRVGCGDFSFRGMASLDAAITSGAAFLTSFDKTSTIPSIQYLCDYYGADVENEDVGSWSASVEHSCTTSNYAVDGDEETFFVKMCKELYPNKSFSFVADSYDYWNFVDNIVRKNKDIILNHTGRINIRPDSGDPEEIICGIAPMWKAHESKEAFESYYTRSEMMQSLYCNETDASGQLVPIYLEIGNKKYIATWSNDGENDTFTYRDATIEERGTLDILWEIFGGTVNSKGYKVLDPHIGMVYGDAITLERCESICNHMANLGYAVENVVFGAGSYSFQYNTRDTQGWAYKATYAEINGKPILVYKDPKTGDGVKKSQKGMVRVYRDKDGEIKYIDGIQKGQVVIDDMKESDINMLETVFLNGEVVRNQTLNEIRNSIHAESRGF